MKKRAISAFLLICLMALSGCNTKSMDYIIAHRPCVPGIVKAVYDDYVIAEIINDSYPSGADCKVSLNVENSDSYTSLTIGDKIRVYYDGIIAETDPLQIDTVYAITLAEPANR